MKIKHSSINFTTLVLLFSPWGNPSVGVLAVKNIHREKDGGLFDQPREDDPVQEAEVCTLVYIYAYLFRFLYTLTDDQSCKLLTFRRKILL